MKRESSLLARHASCRTRHVSRQRSYHTARRAQNEQLSRCVSRLWGPGAEDTSRTEPLVLDADEPPVLLGQNAGPNAGEIVLYVLASSIFTAAAQGFLAHSDDMRPGFSGVNVTCRVKSDAPREQIEALCAHVQRTSPVLDVIRNPVPVSICLLD